MFYFCVVIEIGFPQATYSVSEAAGLFTDIMLSILKPQNPATQVDDSIQIDVAVSVANSSAFGMSADLSRWNYNYIPCMHNL